LVGVGHNFTSALNFGSPRLFHFPFVRSIASSATGVCQNPDALAQMGSAGICRRNDSPFRIEPHRGQVSENSSESPRSEHWAVFHEDDSWSYLANDASHFRPESASLAIDSFASPCCADVLTGKAASHDINNSSPWPSVKRANVIPDRKRREGSIVLSSHKDGLSIGLSLDCADASVPE
jgi:hypothetical protein